MTLFSCVTEKTGQQDKEVNRFAKGLEMEVGHVGKGKAPADRFWLQTFLPLDSCGLSRLLSVS